MNRILDLRQLIAFRHVAQGGSFTLAAHELGLSQSAVTRSLQELERRVGAQLLVRSSRAVHVTPEGEQILSLAERLLELHDAGLERLDRYHQGESGQLTLSTIPSCAAALLPALVSSFAAQRPDVSVQIRDGLAAVVAGEVRRGVADAAIVPVLPGQRLEGLRTRPLLRDGMHAVFPAGHPLGAGDEVSWEDLAREPFVRLSTDSSVRHLTDQGFAAAGVLPLVNHEVANIVTLGGLVAAGFGVSAVPALVLNVLRFAPVEARPLVGPALERTIAVAVAAGVTPTPVAKAFLTHLEEARDTPAPEGSSWVTTAMPARSR